VLKRIFRLIVRLLLLILGLSALLLLLPRLFTALYARSRTFSTGTVPARRVAIVFGAGLSRDGGPSPVLRDRVNSAAALYFSGRVEKLLMSGDNRFIYYNEPGAMKEYALELGVPEEAIVLDFAGRRTYDTCYRARQIFGVKEAVLVTQSFHLPRAIYTCNRLGVAAVGVLRSEEYRQCRGPSEPTQIPATLWPYELRRSALACAGENRFHGS
jgi:vancomycin permeability regulator SanA